MSRHIVKATAYDKKGKVLAVAFNDYSRSHPLQAHFAALVGMPERIYLHAEVAVLLRCKDKQPHKLYIERYTKDGVPAIAAPCPICLRAIKAYGVKEVTFTM